MDCAEWRSVGIAGGGASALEEISMGTMTSPIVDTL
jgi:hypothetical protein